jgi:hypothetical protein
VIAGEHEDDLYFPNLATAYINIHVKRKTVVKIIIE